MEPAPCHPPIEASAAAATAPGKISRQASSTSRETLGDLDEYLQLNQERIEQMREQGEQMSNETLGGAR